MLWDTTLAANVGYIAALLYNQVTYLLKLWIWWNFW